MSERAAVDVHVRRSIEARCPERTFSAGEVLMHVGDTDRSCYFIVSGEVIATSVSTQGSTVVLSRRTAGSLVGDLAALDGAPRSATITARSEVVVRVVSWQQMEALLIEHPAWAVSMLRDLATQFRALTERFALLSEDLRSRVVEVLTIHAAETGDPAFRSSRQELAGWVGATREATTRVLRQLEAEGLVRLGRGMVTVVDQRSLEESSSA
ncbi:MAG: Crp/Fnr family transcriptional regulator [Ilumatobacter sp.]